MTNKIIINKDNFSRSKKKLKKLLEDKGLKLSLSETAELFSQVFGFRNEHDMNKNYFNDEVFPENKNITQKENHKSCLLDFDQTLSQDPDLMISLKNNRGLILISGKTNAGKTTLIDRISKMTQSDDDRIISYEAPINFIINNDRSTLNMLKNKSEKQNKSIFLVFWKNFYDNSSICNDFKFHFNVEKTENQMTLTITDFTTNKEYKFTS